MNGKITMVARILLGLIFFVFGLNGFLNFIPVPPELPPKVTDLMGAFMRAGYLFPLIKGTEVVCGALLLANFYAPAAVVMITPVIVNIVLFHAFLDPNASSLIVPLVIVALWGWLVYAWRHIFCALCVKKV